MKTIIPGTIPVPELHGFLLSAVSPRPIAFASTIDADGNVNLAPFSFFNVFSANPPIMIFSPARSGKTNENKDTYNNIKHVPEVVINVVSFDIVQQMNLASTAYPSSVNEFDKAGFTPIPSEKIKPPRVAESPVQMECKVNQVIELGDHGGAGNLIIAEMLAMHISDEVLNDAGKIDPNLIRLVGRMGGPHYSKAFGDAVFDVPKPGIRHGMGIDQLPLEVRNSKVLTGNDLGILGSEPEAPTTKQIEVFSENERMQQILHEGDPHRQLELRHQYAHELIEQGEVSDALKCLLA